MQFRNVTRADIDIAIDDANRAGGYALHFEETSARGKVITGRIVPDTSFSAGARRSAAGRRLKAACWHAHRDVLQSLFTAKPDARVTTSMADYRGLESFRRQFPHTAYHNIGSTFNPVEYRDACDCEG